jgi:hypothetical protein
MAELGILGLALIVAFLVVVAVTGARAWRPWGRGSAPPDESHGRSPGAAMLGSAPAVALAIFAGGVASATIDWMWELPAAFGLVILAAALDRHRPAIGVRRGQGRRQPRGARAG